MALDFPNSPTDGQVYTDASTGEQWVYESATNSWTSKGLVNTSGGIIYKGSVDITAAPPAGASSGWQYSVLADGTANAGYGPGVTGTVAKGDIIMYTGTGWTDTSHNVPQATAAVAGIDKKLWKKTGTALAPETAADTVQISSGTAALPGLTPVGDPNTGIYSPGADQVAISTNGTGRLFVDASGNVTARASDDSRGVSLSPIGGLEVWRDDGAPLIDFKSSSAEDFDCRIQQVANGLGFLTGGSGASFERLRITSDGKLGLGNSNPAALLDIKGTSGAYPTQVIQHSSIDVEGEFLRISRTDGPIRYHSLRAKHSIIDAVGSNYIQFELHDPSISTTGQNTVLQLDGFSGGRVGIGTTSPGDKLEIDGSGSGIILASPDGTRYRITVANGGTLSVTAV